MNLCWPTVYRIAKSQTLPKQPCVHRSKTFFACGSSAPVRVECEGGTALSCGVPGGAKCSGTRTASATGVMALSVFFQASCSWRSEGLSIQSFSIVPPIQVLRGLPCLGSFSVVHHAHQAHRGAPLSGVLIGRSVCQALKGTPWVGFYSVDRWVSHLKGHPGCGVPRCSSVHQVFDGPASLLFSCRCWRVERERLW